MVTRYRTIWDEIRHIQEHPESRRAKDNRRELRQLIEYLRTAKDHYPVKAETTERR